MFKIMFSGPPGCQPAEYLAAERATIDEAIEYIDRLDHVGANWQVLDTELSDQLVYARTGRENTPRRERLR